MILIELIGFAILVALFLASAWEFKICEQEISWLQNHLRSIYDQKLLEDFKQAKTQALIAIACDTVGIIILGVVLICRFFQL